MFHVLERWAKRRHSRKYRMWWLRRYWHRDETREWVFSPKSVGIRYHILVRNSANFYLDTEYFESRRNMEPYRIPNDVTAFLRAGWMTA